MSYRDELEAANARVSALESELERTNQALGRHRGTALTRANDAKALLAAQASPAARIGLGGPTHVRVERQFEFEIDEDCAADLVGLMQLELGPGSTSLVRGALSWSLVPQGVARVLSLRVNWRGGKTTMVLEERFSPLLGGLYGGILGGVGGGGTGVIAPLAAKLAFGLVLIPVWIGGTYLVTRAIYRRKVKTRAARLLEIADKLSAILDGHRAKS